MGKIKGLGEKAIGIVRGLLAGEAHTGEPPMKRREAAQALGITAMLEERKALFPTA